MEQATKIKYFHNLKEQEWKDIVKNNPHMTWQEAGEKYPQPKWCGYTEAVCGSMGCWSLMSFMISRAKDCHKCDLYHKYETGRKF